MELAMERLRNENSARAATAVQVEDRRLKYTSILLKDIFVRMPTEESLVSLWYDDVEATFDSYNMPDEGRAWLVLPSLSEKARGFIVCLSANKRKDYNVFKETVLKGLHLSSTQYH